MTKLENKYQVAFNRLKNDIERGNCDYNVSPYLLTIQELVNKETPMLVTDIHIDEFYCPKCHAEITHDINNYLGRPTYCEECGQRLDWGCYDD